MEGGNACSHCAISLCSKCILLGKPCHIAERGKSICSIHTKDPKPVKIQADNMVLLPHNVTRKFNMTLFTYKSDDHLKIFKSFYSEFNV